MAAGTKDLRSSHRAACSGSVEPAQIALDLGCERCGAPAVGHSITGEGHVCKRCNAIEWGESLRTYWPEMSRKLLAPASGEASERG